MEQMDLLASLARGWEPSRNQPRYPVRVDPLASKMRAKMDNAAPSQSGITVTAQNNILVVVPVVCRLTLSSQLRVM